MPTVRSIETQEVNQFFAEPKTAVVAIIDFNGETLHVSQFPEETEWVVDARFAKNGFPVFSNGVGSRVTLAKVLTESIVQELELNEKRDSLLAV